jgi:glycosyltransferase involved in cell wall biosynthesis
MAGRVLFISENAPVPSDRRVWNEARTLHAAGWEVVVACAQGDGRHDAPYELIEGIEIHRFPLAPASGGLLGYAREYGQAMWRINRLAHRLGRERGFDVVHACNPPDFLLLAALGLRRKGARFVFDHHDLVPELFEAKFGGGPMLRVAKALERIPYRLADVVISTNGSYRHVALERGGAAADTVFVVRNGPDLERFRPAEPDPAWRRGRKHLLAYLGIMGPQDGLDHALEALGRLRAERDDWQAVFIGEGDMLPEMRALAERLGITEHVEFAGWRFDEDIRTILSTADVCLAPDPPSPLNDVSTMIKIPEYMAMGCPIVSYDLTESRVSAGDAALYATPGDVDGFAARIAELLEDPELCARMGAIGRERVERELSWQHSEPVLLAAYARALQTSPATAARAVEPAPARS